MSCTCAGMSLVVMDAPLMQIGYATRFYPELRRKIDLNLAMSSRQFSYSLELTRNISARRV